MESLPEGIRRSHTLLHVLQVDAVTGFLQGFKFLDADIKKVRS